MEKPELINVLEVNKSFTDVLFLTNSDRIPNKIKKLFKQKKLSHKILPIDSFSEVSSYLNSIGTVLIDTQGQELSENVVRIIETLEIERIGVILLTEQPCESSKGFSLSTIKNCFSLGQNSESVSIEDLWARLSVNLSFRKKKPNVKIKQATPPKQVHTIHKNKLAEQLASTKSLVDNLAEQLRLAGLVQQDFLPSKLPNSEKIQWANMFMPAEWVSGDIFDAVRLDEDHIGFYIADVVSNLNIKMTAQKLSGYQFATCCYCLLNTQTLVLTYARAGHPYPILLRPGKEPEQLEVRGSLLGVFEQAEYYQNTVQLEPGDKILIYSDGAESCIGSFNNQAGFTFTKLFNELKNKNIREMISGFSTYMQEKEFSQAEIDDITILGFEILN